MVNRSPFRLTSHPETPPYSPCLSDWRHFTPVTSSLCSEADVSQGLTPISSDLFAIQIYLQHQIHLQFRHIQRQQRGMRLEALDCAGGHNLLPLWPRLLLCPIPFAKTASTVLSSFENRNILGRDFAVGSP